MTDIPLLNSLDMEILMHRDVHFGGSFDVMLEYYDNEGIGCMPDFERSRIFELKLAEEDHGGNLSESILPEPAQQEVQRAKKVYVDLRSVYEEGKGELPCLLSDLILSEELLPQKEIDAIVEKGTQALSPLIDLLHADRFYDPLYPGYGRAPILAAKCLAAIGDKTAIGPLFQALDQDNFFTDESIIKSLIAFGTPAKTFLIERLLQKPPSKDNERAAIALSSFPHDPDIGHAFITLLKDPELTKNTQLAIYAACGCSDLTDPAQLKEFTELSDAAHLKDQVQSEIALILKIKK